MNENIEERNRKTTFHLEELVRNIGRINRVMPDLDHYSTSLAPSSNCNIIRHGDQMHIIYRNEIGEYDIQIKGPVNRMGIVDDVLNSNIDLPKVRDLTARAKNVLSRCGVQTYGELFEYLSGEKEKSLTKRPAIEYLQFVRDCGARVFEFIVKDLRDKGLAETFGINSDTKYSVK